MIAGSVDPVEKTIELADKLGVAYPVAYGLEAKAISRLTGSFYEKEKRYLQPTGIIVRPDKNTACLPIVVPSSSAMCGAIGSHGGIIRPLVISMDPCRLLKCH